jgi:IclR family acetate operon transcriptional repressor
VETAESVWESVRRVRESGYSVDDEEDSIGVRCLGAAIRGAGGRPLFAVSITGPSPRFTLEACAQLAPTLLSVAGRLSQQFGGDSGIVNRALTGGAWNAA